MATSIHVNEEDDPGFQIEDIHHTEVHIPLHCQLQKILMLLNRFKHNASKSCIAMDVWVNRNKQAELREETIELQKIIRSDLNKIIDSTSISKSEASMLIATLHELKGKNEKLEQDLQAKSQQCSALQKQIDALNFDDMEISMIESHSEQDKKEIPDKTFQQNVEEPAKDI